MKKAPFAPPAPARSAFFLSRWISPLYLRRTYGLRGVSDESGENLRRALELFGPEHRLLILFRHTSAADAPVLIHRMLRFAPPPLARPPESALFSKAQNRALPGPMAHFLYGREVLRWAPAPARWLFPRLGALPVNWGRIDRRSADWLYRLAVEGPRPLALAPEGQVTYRLGRVSPLGSGAVHLLEHILSRGLRVSILPAAVVYVPPERYPAAAQPGERLDRDGFLREWLRLFQQVQHRFSLRPSSPPEENRIEALRRWWQELMLQLLTQCGRLGEEGGVPLPPGRPGSPGRPGGPARTMDPEDYISHMIPLRQAVRLRLRQILKSRGSRENRQIRALREAAAGLEVFDLGEYMDPRYYTAGPAYRLLEGRLNLWDLENRLRGGNIGSRRHPPGFRARIVWGRPREADPQQLAPPAEASRKEKRLLQRTAWHQLIRESLESISGKNEPDKYSQSFFENSVYKEKKGP